MRLFIAVRFEPIYFKEIQERLPKVSLAMGFHITLSFLGEADAEAIQERLSALEFRTFSVKTSHIGMFSNVIWVGIEENAELMELQNKVFSLCPGKDDHSFHPHITLARFKHMEKSDIDKVKSITIERKEFPVDKVVLFKSTLTPEGAVYESLSEIEGK